MQTVPSYRLNFACRNSDVRVAYYLDQSLESLSVEEEQIYEIQRRMCKKIKWSKLQIPTRWTHWPNTSRMPDRKSFIQFIIEAVLLIVATSPSKFWAWSILYGTVVFESWDAPTEFETNPCACTINSCFFCKQSWQSYSKKLLLRINRAVPRRQIINRRCAIQMPTKTLSTIYVKTVWPNPYINPSPNAINAPTKWTTITLVSCKIYI